MYRRVTLAILASLLGLAASAGEPTTKPAPAENAPPPTEPETGTSAAEKQLPEFSTLDLDGDATISEEEARGHAGLSAIFAQSDSDRNGSLSTWEFAEARTKLDQ